MVKKCIVSDLEAEYKIKDISDYFSIPFSTTKSIKNKPPVSNKSKYYGWKITEC